MLRGLDPLPILKVCQSQIVMDTGGPSFIRSKFPVNDSTVQIATYRVNDPPHKIGRIVIKNRLQNHQSVLTASGYYQRLRKS